MMYSDKAELRDAANWAGVKGGSREQLMEQLQGISKLCQAMVYWYDTECG